LIRKIFQISFHALKTTFRNRSNFLWLIIMPIIWTTLIGTMSTSDGGDDKIQVGFLNRDGGIYGEVFSEILRKEESIKIVEVAGDNEEKMRDLVKDNKLSMSVIIPNDFSEKLKAGDQVKIEILKSERDTSYFLDELITKAAERIFIDALSANFTLEKFIERKAVSESEIMEIEKKKIWEDAFKGADEFFKPVPPPFM
jgi:ABC-type Na+ efflux pump permease subunit